MKDLDFYKVIAALDAAKSRLVSDHDTNDGTIALIDEAIEILRKRIRMRGRGSEEREDLMTEREKEDREFAEFIVKFNQKHGSSFGVFVLKEKTDGESADDRRGGAGADRAGAEGSADDPA